MARAKHSLWPACAFAALALANAPATADEPPTTFIDATGTFQNLDPSVGSTGQDWGLRGHVTTRPFGGDLPVDVFGSYHNVSGGGASDNSIGGGVSLILGSDTIAWGPSIGFQHNDTGTFSTDTFNYGLYLQWYAAQWLTFVAAGGWFDESSFFDSDGYYEDLEAEFYLCDQFSLAPHFNYSHFNGVGDFNEQDVGVRAEYLVTGIGDTPISVFTNYEHTTFPGGFGGFHVDTIGIGITAHFNGDDTLRGERHDTVSPSTWFQPLSLRF